MRHRNFREKVPVVEFLVQLFLPVLSLGIGNALLHVLDLELTMDLAVQDFDLVVLQLIQIFGKRVLRLDPTVTHWLPFVRLAKSPDCTEGAAISGGGVLESLEYGFGHKR
jgi:hypothetical protein